MGGHPRVEESERLPDPVVRRIAGDDAVVVVGKALRLGERLMPAARAADEVRVIGKAAGMVAHDQFRVLGHHVNRSIRPVDDFLGVTLTEFHVIAGVSGVGARGRVATAQRRGQRGVADRTRIAAVSDTLELTVPCVGRRHPDFEPDLRVARGPCDRFDAAERGQHDLLSRARNRERSRRHGRRGSNTDAWHRQRRQVLTGGPVPVRGRCGCGERRGHHREDESGRNTAGHESSVRGLYARTPLRTDADRA